MNPAFTPFPKLTLAYDRAKITHWPAEQGETVTLGVASTWTGNDAETEKAPRRMLPMRAETTHHALRNLRREEGVI